MEPTKPGWKTTEFWLTLAAKILGGLFAAGVLGDGTLAMRIAGIAAAVLTSLGYTVSRSIVKAAAVLLVVGLAGSTQLGCATVRQIPSAAGHAIVDCTSQDSPKLLTLTLDFVNALLSGTGWTDLETRAEAEGTAAQCAFVEVWARLHPTQASGIAALLASPSLLEKLRSASGGVQWKLNDGSVK